VPDQKERAYKKAGHEKMDCRKVFEGNSKKERECPALLMQAMRH
jgi:hypothetical protein